MAKYEMKFMFDFGSGCCIRSINKAAEDLYNYPVLAEQLPISSELKSVLQYLIDKYDEALDWSCPQNGLLWSAEQIQAFKVDAIAAYERLCAELGVDYKVVL